MVAHSSFWGGVVVPLATGGLLLILPYIDTHMKGAGFWFSKDRWIANTLFLVCVLVSVLLILIGFWFRGPDWVLQWPWNGGGS